MGEIREAIVIGGSAAGLATARKLALDYEDANDAELTRWFKQAVKADRQSAPYRLAVARGEIEPGNREPPKPGAKIDSREMMRSLLTDGFAVAARTDPLVFRAMMRSYNLLDQPDAVMKDKDVLNRIMKVWQERGSRKPDIAGPGRAEMLEILKSVAA